MRKILIVLTLFSMSFLFGCASERRIPTFKEAVAENPNLDSGIYNKSNGENVQVTVTSMKARIEELEKQLYDARHEADYYKRTNGELEHENLGIRVKGNYELDHETTEVEGFDARHNPIVNKATKPLLPQRLPATPPPAVAEPEAAALKTETLSAIEPPKAPAAPKAPDPVAKAPEAPTKATEAPKADVAKTPEPSKPATELPKDTKADLALKQ